MKGLLMGEALNMLEVITAGKRCSKRVFRLMDAVIMGSDVEACIAIRRNRILLRWWATKHLRYLRRQLADPPDGLCESDIREDITTVVRLLRTLEPFYLKRARGMLTSPARCCV